jgi:hypothetical protein
METQIKKLIHDEVEEQLEKALSKIRNNPDAIKELSKEIKAMLGDKELVFQYLNREVFDSTGFLEKIAEFVALEIYDRMYFTTDLKIKFKKKPTDGFLAENNKLKVNNKVIDLE